MYIAAAFAAIVLASTFSPAVAQINKCVVGGNTVYQQDVCERAGGTGERIKVYPSGDGPSGSGAHPLEGSPAVIVDPIPTSSDEARSIFGRQRAAISAGLKDPSSAQFQAVGVVRTKHSSGDITYFCGMVNAKNSYGGFVGYQPFVSDGRGIEIETKNFVIYRKLGGTWYDVRPVWNHCLAKGVTVGRGPPNDASSFAISPASADPGIHLA